MILTPDKGHSSASAVLLFTSGQSFTHHTSIKYLSTSFKGETEVQRNSAKNGAGQLSEPGFSLGLFVSKAPALSFVGKQMRRAH